MLGETEKSSDVCRTASLSEMGHEQRVATSYIVTVQRRKNFFVRRSSFGIEVPPNRRVLQNGDDGDEIKGLLLCWSYLATGSTSVDVGLSCLPAPRSQTVFLIPSETGLLVLTYSDAR